MINQLIEKSILKITISCSPTNGANLWQAQASDPSPYLSPEPPVFPQHVNCAGSRSTKPLQHTLTLPRWLAVGGSGAVNMEGPPQTPKSKKSQGSDGFY